MTLSKYYKKYNVNFKRPDYKYYKSIAQKENLKEKQLEFVKNLGTIIMERAYHEIIYIDETTFHLLQRMSKCWVRPGMKLRMVNH